jgi:hypothetical protein
LVGAEFGEQRAEQARAHELGEQAGCAWFPGASGGSSEAALSALETKIQSTPLIAAVTKCLFVKQHTTVVDGFSLAQDSAVLLAFREAWKQRQELEKRRIEAEQRIVAKAARAEDVRVRLKDAATARDKALAEAKIDTDLTKLQGLLTELTGTLETDLRRPRSDIALAGAVATRFDTFATTVMAVPSGGGYAPIIGAALRERLHGDNQGLTHVLFLSVDTAGAETVTIRGLFRQKALFVGGLHVSYLVLGVKEEKIVASGTAGRIRQVNYKLSSGACERVDQQDLNGA